MSFRAVCVYVCVRVFVWMYMCVYAAYSEENYVCCIFFWSQDLVYDPNCVSLPCVSPLFETIP